MGLRFPAEFTKISACKKGNRKPLTKELPLLYIKARVSEGGLMDKSKIGVFTHFKDSPEETTAWVKRCEVDNIQLLCPPDEYFEGEPLERMIRAFSDAGIKITTLFCCYPGESYADIPTVRETVGLVNPATRGERIRKTYQISDLAKKMGIDVIAAHIGFVPEDPSDPLYDQIVETMKDIADYAKQNAQLFSLETGQESAETLLRFLKDVDRDNLRVNFDPANMILYGSGNPIEALRLVGSYVVGVHCKDGAWPKEKDKLGEERPLGDGEVNIPLFIQKLKEVGYDGYLTIEREITGEEQVQDILKAKALLESLI